MNKPNIIRERSMDFAVEIIQVYMRMVEQREYVLSKQLVRAATSIGANVAESSAAQSRADFVSKMSIASKEARETQYWLELIRRSNIVHIDLTDASNECDELVRILTAIVRSTSETRQS